MTRPSRVCVFHFARRDGYQTSTTAMASCHRYSPCYGSIYAWYVTFTTDARPSNAPHSSPTFTNTAARCMIGPHPHISRTCIDHLLMRPTNRKHTQENFSTVGVGGGTVTIRRRAWAIVLTRTKNINKLQLSVSTLQTLLVSAATYSIQENCIRIRISRRCHARDTHILTHTRRRRSITCTHKRKRTAHVHGHSHSHSDRYAHALDRLTTEFPYIVSSTVALHHPCRLYLVREVPGEAGNMQEKIAIECLLEQSV